MSAVGLPNSVWRAVHIIGPGSAVDVDVYEARGDIPVASVEDDVGGPAGATFGNADDLAVLAFDGAAFQDPVRENDLSSEGDSGGAHRKRIS